MRSLQSSTYCPYAKQDAIQDAKNPLIVASAEICRGIDLPDITHVFLLAPPRYALLVPLLVQFTNPFRHVLRTTFFLIIVDTIIRDPNTYLHLAGRTGRMGKTGEVITLIDEPDMQKLRRTANSLGVRFQIHPSFPHAGYPEIIERNEKKQSLAASEDSY